MKGYFIWKNKPTDKHDLTVEATPAGPNQWNLLYYFVWNKKDTVYEGTMTGDPKNGTVKGDAKMRGDEGPASAKNRFWTFTGTAKDGVITIEHFEKNKNGGQGPTGTGTLTVQ